MEVILQSEAAECGLACLAMVGAHHNQHTSLRELRLRHPSSLRGSTLAQVIDIAGKMGFSSRPLRLELHELSQLRLPCVLHFDLNHFVVLSRVTRKGVVVLDPASGRRKLTIEEISQRFSGVALELTPTISFARAERPRSITISQLTGPISGLWRSLALVLLLSISLQVFVVLAPFFMQCTVDHALVSADRDLLTVLCLGFGLALLLQTAISYVRGISVIFLSSQLGVQWGNNVFNHLIRLPLDYYEKRHLGDVTSRMGSIQTIQRTLTTSFIEALIDGLMALVTLLMMLLYSWKLALITVVAVSAYFSVRWIAFGSLRAGTQSQLVSAARQSSHLLESIRGIQSIKVSGRENLRSSGYHNLVSDTFSRDVFLQRIGLAFSSGNQLIFGVERIAVVWVGALLAMQSVFSVGMLIAYLAYKDQFAQRVGSLIDRFIEFRMLRLHLERLSDIVLTAPEEPTWSGISEELPARLRIEVDDVSFRYADGEPWVLRNCSFDVEPGESVAITGASGCGKTTLVKLLLGLLLPTEGDIRVGGVSLRKIPPHYYRSVVGAVLQEDQLFAGNVSDNIAFGEEDADQNLVRLAATLASVHDDISSMPMGYSSLVGDMGTTLSGGQKQRILLARALYRRPRLLFLDEATSHLDVHRERLVNEAVKRLDLTRVIIAHRAETIASADRIISLRGGRVEPTAQCGNSETSDHASERSFA